jgi:cell division protein FtsQ
MPLYQGRALAPHAERARRRRPSAARLLALGVLAPGLGFAASRLPWGEWRARYAVVTRIEVRGNRYLDAERVAAVAGVRARDDLVGLDLRRLRDRLAAHPRVARAEVHRAIPRGVTLVVQERLPVLVVDHSTPWEMDSSGVVMPPLAPGALADVPLLTGPDLSRFPAGARCESPAVKRGLAWLRRLGDPRLQLVGDLSELDVSDPATTALVLFGGTRVLAPAWPPGAERLSALRVVLADLTHRGVTAGEVDLRFSDQVIVRPVVAAAASPESRYPTSGR